MAIASQRIMAGEGELFVAGGVESISCVQNEKNTHFNTESWLEQNKPGNILEHATDCRNGCPALQCR